MTRLKGGSHLIDNSCIAICAMLLEKMTEAAGNALLKNKSERECVLAGWHRSSRKLIDWYLVAEERVRVFVNDGLGLIIIVGVLLLFDYFGLFDADNSQVDSIITPVRVEIKKDRSADLFARVEVAFV